MYIVTCRRPRLDPQSAAPGSLENVQCSPSRVLLDRKDQPVQLCSVKASSLLPMTLHIFD
jgi:hypothetical protein